MSEVKEGKQEDGSEIIKVGKSLTCQAKQDHYFIRQGKDAICSKCPIGYPLGIAQVRQGHIYIGEELVI